jgi:transposase InsO family protein
MRLCKWHHVGLLPPTTYVESFNATVRLECLGPALDDAHEKVEKWHAEYNEVRPHSAIGDRTPLSLIHLPRTARRGAPTRPRFSSEPV